MSVSMSRHELKASLVGTSTSEQTVPVHQSCVASTSTAVITEAHEPATHAVVRADTVMTTLNPVDLHHVASDHSEASNNLIAADAVDAPRVSVDECRTQQDIFASPSVSDKHDHHQSVPVQGGHVESFSPPLDSQIPAGQQAAHTQPSHVECIEETLDHGARPPSLIMLPVTITSTPVLFRESSELIGSCNLFLPIAGDKDDDETRHTPQQQVSS